MIQFNLLPDVKLQYIKARRVKRLVTLVSIVVSAASLFVFLLFIISVDVVQKKSLNDLTKDINSNTSQLKGISNLDKILTVQNQLNTLTGLHDKKAATSRLFTYLAQITPQGVSISSLNADFTQNTITMSGNATDLATINTLIDTLKATAYHTDANAAPTKAFSKVVLTTFSRSGKGTTASYGTTFSFDPIIFSNTDKVSLDVPKSTVSSTSALFQGTGQ